MKRTNYTTVLIIIVGSLFAVFLLTGASQDRSNDRWTIFAISGEKTGLYIMDQRTGDIYFLDDDPRIARTHVNISKLGNISEAR